MTNNNCIAIIGDIVKSKAIKNRNQVQEKMQETLEHINHKYADIIASKFLITIGDEFQGLLKPTNQLFRIIDEIADSMEPVEIRFGVGSGTITTSLKEYALGIDGPAFYQARSAINKAHKYKRYIIIFQSEDPDEYNLAIHTTLVLLSQIRLLWTDSQKRVIRLFRNGLTQEQIAAELTISQSAVSQAMEKSRVIAILDAEQNIESLLSERFKHKH